MTHCDKQGSLWLHHKNTWILTFRVWLSFTPEMATPPGLFYAYAKYVRRPRVKTQEWWLTRMTCCTGWRWLEWSPPHRLRVEGSCRRMVEGDHWFRSARLHSIQSNRSPYRPILHIQWQRWWPHPKYDVGQENQRWRQLYEHGFLHFTWW